MNDTPRPTYRPVMDGLIRLYRTSDGSTFLTESDAQLHADPEPLAPSESERCDYPGCLGPADGSECRHPRLEDEDPDAPDDGLILVAGVLYDAETLDAVVAECDRCAEDILESEDYTVEVLDDGTEVHRHEVCYDDD